MGWIEDLSRKNADDQRRFQVEAQKKQVQHAAEQMKWKREREVHVRKVELSKGCFEASAFRQMCDELKSFKAISSWRNESGDIGYGGDWGVNGRDRSNSTFIQGIISDDVEYRIDVPSENHTVRKAFTAEFCYDGVLVVYGKKTKQLSLGQWQGRRDVQERALRDAFEHPLIFILEHLEGRN